MGLGCDFKIRMKDDREVLWDSSCLPLNVCRRAFWSPPPLPNEQLLTVGDNCPSFDFEVVKILQLMTSENTCSSWSHPSGLGRWLGQQLSYKNLYPARTGKRVERGIQSKSTFSTLASEREVPREGRPCLCWMGKWRKHGKLRSN